MIPNGEKWAAIWSKIVKIAKNGQTRQKNCLSGLKLSNMVKMVKNGKRWRAWPYEGRSQEAWRASS